MCQQTYTVFSFVMRVRAAAASIVGHCGKTVNFWLCSKHLINSGLCV